MEQAKALNALEPFLALTKSATSPRAAADLIVRATSAPNSYIFTELLQTPQVQALAASPEFAPHLRLLEIFSYGIYLSYTSTPGLPELNDAQRLKLRQLSLMTLADRKTADPSATESALSYASLQRALDLPTRQALEELVISAIYAGLLKAQLNPKDSLVQINSVAPLRDVAPKAIGGLLSSLQAWSDRCDATLESLSEQMAQLRADADRRAAQTASWEEKTKKLIKDEKKGGNTPSTASSTTAPPFALRTSYNHRSNHRAQRSGHVSHLTAPSGGLNPDLTANLAGVLSGGGGDPPTEIDSMLTSGGSQHPSAGYQADLGSPGGFGLGLGLGDGNGDGDGSMTWDDAGPTASFSMQQLPWAVATTSNASQALKRGSEHMDTNSDGIELDDESLMGTDAEEELDAKAKNRTSRRKLEE